MKAEYVESPFHALGCMRSLPCRFPRSGEAYRCLKLQAMWRRRWHSFPGLVIDLVGTRTSSPAPASGSRRSTYRAGLRRLGYDPRVKHEEPPYSGPSCRACSIIQWWSLRAQHLGWFSRIFHWRWPGAPLSYPRPVGAHSLLAGPTTQPLPPPPPASSAPYGCRAERSRLSRFRVARRARPLIGGSNKEHRPGEFRRIYLPPHSGQWGL